MKTTFMIVACSLLITGAFFFSCSKSSLIEGIDTPYKYPDYTGYKGWLQVWIDKGGAAAQCDELKIYDGIHYLGKVTKDYVFDESYKVTCGDNKALQISLPPGTYTIVASGTCGSVTSAKIIRALYCTTMEIK
jgi:hypothetical protein